MRMRETGKVNERREISDILWEKYVITAGNGEGKMRYAGKENESGRNRKYRMKVGITGKRNKFDNISNHNREQ